MFAVFLLLCSLGFSQNTPDPQSQFLNLVVPQGQSNMTVQLPSVPSIPNINVQVPAPPSMPQEQPESQEPQLKVVKKTVYVGQDSVFSGLDELSKYGTEGLDIVKTSAGYIYKSRYSQDKWVEVGSDAKGSYVSLIKVVEKEAIEQPPSIDSIPPMPAQPQQPAWQDKAVLPNVMPSLAFDSSDAAVVQRELDYLSKRFVFVPQESQAKEYVEQAFGIPSPPPLNQQPATQG
ncbi:hypothetical protein FJZ26_01615, partial [Candidatus Parvarchaeota archaeon]|nr:hypothetical protein [Candidatus Parvarchaeota archaeon]